MPRKQRSTYGRLDCVQGGIQSSATPILQAPPVADTLRQHLHSTSSTFPRPSSVSLSTVSSFREIFLPQPPYHRRFHILDLRIMLEQVNCTPCLCADERGFSDLREDGIVTRSTSGNNVLFTLRPGEDTAGESPASATLVRLAWTGMLGRCAMTGEASMRADKGSESVQVQSYRSLRCLVWSDYGNQAIGEPPGNVFRRFGK